MYTCIYRERVLFYFFKWKIALTVQQGSHPKPHNLDVPIPDVDHQDHQYTGTLVEKEQYLFYHALQLSLSLFTMAGNLGVMLASLSRLER